MPFNTISIHCPTGKFNWSGCKSEEGTKNPLDKITKHNHVTTMNGRVKIEMDRFIAKCCKKVANKAPNTMNNQVKNVLLNNTIRATPTSAALNPYNPDSTAGFFSVKKNAKIVAVVVAKSKANPYCQFATHNASKKKKPVNEFSCSIICPIPLNTDLRKEVLFNIEKQSK